MCACVYVCLASFIEYRVGPNHAWHWDNGVLVPAAGVLQWRAVTVSKHAPTMNPFLTKCKTSDDRHVQPIRSYLAIGVGYLELEPIRSKDRGLLTYNIDITSNKCSHMSLWCFLPSITSTHGHFLLSHVRCIMGSA